MHGRPSMRLAGDVALLENRIQLLKKDEVSLYDKVVEVTNQLLYSSYSGARTRATTAEMKAKCRLLLQGRFQDCLRRVLSHRRSVFTDPISRSHPEAGIRIATRRAASGRFHRAMEALTSKGVHPFNQDILHSLQSKFPRAGGDRPARPAPEYSEPWDWRNATARHLKAASFEDA
eukprot:2688629-Prorocentrum_lima.AAC.1